ncbi:hypothetical protein IF1G_10914 [Cordyceps javanica]|uniref:Uncharacterized protein n=1 Tax=Cordyceps javanica TaxID=43265 RepID=A0A545ULU7_9HYPO|nr:hypothetical protein IF1G_10914 [Cordyceps javanica]
MARGQILTVKGQRLYAMDAGSYKMCDSGDTECDAAYRAIWVIFLISRLRNWNESHVRIRVCYGCYSSTRIRIQSRAGGASERWRLVRTSFSYSTIIVSRCANGRSRINARVVKRQPWFLVQECCYGSIQGGDVRQTSVDNGLLYLFN